jgi:predicted RNase H-like nuclease (RuvC/YqgF family)
MGGRQVVAAIPLVGNLAGPWMIGSLENQITALNSKVAELQRMNEDNLTVISGLKEEARQLEETIGSLNEANQREAERLRQLIIQTKQLLEEKNDRIDELEDLLEAERNRVPRQRVF